jgi:MSHA pilin protein MshC
MSTLHTKTFATIPGPRCQPYALLGDARGFTLIELIMVIVLIGVLAVFAAPKLNLSIFNERGFHDETLAYLRYAQKTAIAQRRTVCVTVAGACPADASKVTVTMTVFTQNPATTTCAPATLVSCSKTPTLPGEQCPLTLPFAPRCGTALTGTPSTFAFTPEGNTDISGIANTAVAVTITGTGSPITVEKDTGYIHE